MWKYRGQARPSFAENPSEGQESAWDYPRPPKLDFTDKEVLVKKENLILAKSVAACRVLETASPPGYYIPVEDIRTELLKQASGTSFCEWKGRAVYWQIANDPAGVPVGWSYPDPTASFRPLKDYISFYPGRVECFVNGEKVLPQPGEFYGGWITSEVVGPFKGLPGSGHW